VAAGAAFTGGGLARAGERSAAGRAVRRLASTTGELARVRSVGDLGRWCWDVGWGLGYAFGKVEVPEPVVVPPQLPGAAAPPVVPGPASPPLIERTVRPDALAS
jgi:hypothetical protein